MRRGSVIRAIAALAIGLAYWWTVAAVSAVREPWDAPSYWTIAYPLALLLAMIVGAIGGRTAWLAGASLILAQAMVVVVRSTIGPLWPVGLLFLIVLALPGALAAALGAWLARR